MNTVSIIIPCYNGEDVIGRSIKSVYTQEYKNIELIVVDDGSTDASKLKILSWKERFEQKGFILKYIYQNNQGLGAAIDTGLKHVTGQYLSLLDADDYFLSNSICKRSRFLDDNPEYVGVRSNGWMKCGEEKNLFIISEEEKEITDLFEGLILGKTNNWAGTYMVRTDVLFAFYPNRNIYPSRYGQNMQILLPVAYKNKFGFIDEPLMVYVVHENSLSQASLPEEQYQKEEESQKGYRDIYMYMLRLIVKEEDEYEKYFNYFSASYHRCAMLRAEKYGKKSKLNESYYALRKTGLVTINDKICFYSHNCLPISYYYKFVRRLVKMMKR